MADNDIIYTPNYTPWYLLCLLVFLIVVVIFLYKKLNRDTDGQYTIKRMVYKEGGVRDRVRGAALALGAFLGVQLWPRSDTNEDGEEMQEVHDEEAQAAEGDSQESDTDDEEEHDYCNEEKDKRGDDALDANTCVAGAEASEEVKLIDETEPEEKGEEKQEAGEERQGKAEASGGPGLLIDLKQFSGSAIWSGEEPGEVSDITPL